MKVSQLGPVALGLLLVASCQADDDVCVAAAATANACGMPLTVDECKALSSTDQEQMLTGLASLQCGSTSGDDPSPETCKLAGWPCPPALGPAPQAIAPEYPLVFVSGIESQAEFDWNPQVLSEVATATGATVIHATLPSWSSTNERASALWSTLLDHGAGNPGVKFNLIGYAVGGLDCRTLASPVGLFADDPDSYAVVNGSIASITTMSTPHRGTRVADATVIALQSDATSSLVTTVTGYSFPEPVVSGDLLDVLNALTLSSESRRSASLTDGPGIYYQSFAGVSHVNGDASSPSVDEVSAACVDSTGSLNLLGGTSTTDSMQAALWVTAPFGGASMDDSGNVSLSPTDGMVAVESAKWGTFRGCLPTDHYHVIGEIARGSRDVMTGFDVGRFYGWLANDLAGMGY